MKKLKVGILFCAVMLAALTATAAAIQQEQQMLAEKLIRLHVVANSDSETDQLLKLQVRDAVLAVTASVDAAEGDPAMQLIGMMPQIKEAAEGCLRRHGSSERVQVQFGREIFPMRSYDNFALPAGVYRSLRVVIGDGEGENWWCVVFPSICFRASAAELEEAAQTAGLTAGEIRLITEDPDGYTLKFKSLELLRRLKDIWLQ